jgi:hypothetical protein
MSLHRLRIRGFRVCLEKLRQSRRIPPLRIRLLNRTMEIGRELEVKRD